jgi:UDPglucose 6-dehydrogenase
MAALGHDVVGIDLDEEKVAALAAGRTPFFEPGLLDLLTETLAGGRLRFSTRIAEAAGADVHFIAVGTPQAPDGSADLAYVDAAITGLIPHLRPGDVVVGKSTVPVGTAARLAARIAPTGARLVWNPEFLREGFAVADTLRPDRIVYGLEDADALAAQVLDQVYAAALAAGTPRLITDLATAELVKVAANAFLATKISFINAMAEIAEVVGADVTQLADAIGHDARIGRRFLNAGVGFGGGCLPKDIRGFVARAEELGVGEAVGFLKEVDRINLRRRDRIVTLAAEAVGGDLRGRRVALLGLAFKPDSDDVRDSPALEIARRLRERGADVVATDPHAIGPARRAEPDLRCVPELRDALTGAEVVILVTEWALYRTLDPVAARRLVAAPTMIDGRNALAPEQWRAAGWSYTALGRGRAPGSAVAGAAGSAVAAAVPVAPVPVASTVG